MSLEKYREAVGQFNSLSEAKFKRGKKNFNWQGKGKTKQRSDQGEVTKIGMSTGGDADKRAKKARGEQPYKQADGKVKVKGLKGGDIHVPSKTASKSGYKKKVGNPWHDTSGKFAPKEKVAKSRGTFSLRGTKSIAKTGQEGKARLGGSHSECGRDARGHAVGYKHGTQAAKRSARKRPYRADYRCWDDSLVSPNPDKAAKRGLPVTGIAKRKAAKGKAKTVAKLGQASGRGGFTTKGATAYDADGRPEKIGPEKVKSVGAGVGEKRRKLSDRERLERTTKKGERRRKAKEIKSKLKDVEGPEDKNLRKAERKKSKQKIKSLKGRHGGKQFKKDMASKTSSPEKADKALGIKRGQSKIRKGQAKKRK